MKKNLKPVSNLKRKRKHGFLKRNDTKAGQQILTQRRKKGRHKIAV
ncbi:MAG: 50S ribosomal protein L34 [Candidatus Saelkia tenebricola]|nr:50S ribosomal protein L34 [Candidatus Saelkia tenebricola]